eukprot:4001300-Prorocentrum_lima.AAC.1
MTLLVHDWEYRWRPTCPLGSNALVGPVLVTATIYPKAGLLQSLPVESCLMTSAKYIAAYGQKDCP